MPATAKSNYTLAVAVVDSLLKLEGSYSDPPTFAETATVEGLRGGAAVLMVAAFENYLREAVGEAVERVNNASPPCRFQKLPQELQQHAIYASLELAMKGDFNSVGKKKYDRIADIRTAIAKIQAESLDSDALSQTGGNPDSARVKTMLKALGVSNVFANIQRPFEAKWGPAAKTFVSNTLDIIVRRRHVVAHTASALTIARTDLASGQHFMIILTDVLDAAIDRHMARVISAAQ